MSRELWAVEKCEHRNLEAHMYGDFQPCEGGEYRALDFDAIWDRYYMASNRRHEKGLTYNELYEIVYGQKKEEEE